MTLTPQMPAISLSQPQALAAKPSRPSLCHVISDQDQANKNGASLSISCNSNSWLNHVFFSFRNSPALQLPYMAAMNDIASVTWPRSSSSKKWCDNSSNLRLLTLPWDLMEGAPQKIDLRTAILEKMVWTHLSATMTRLLDVSLLHCTWKCYICPS